LVIAAKSLISVGFVKLLSLSTPWNDIFGAFHGFRVPGLFILVLDITLKYIMILGGMALEMLQALKLRSIGRNSGKTQSLAGIAGMLFLKSRHLAQEVFWAMECRGFTADYRPRFRHRLTLPDAGLLLLDGGLIAAFVFCLGKAV
jgi:cobalt/nickel transport system permease protein